MEPWQSLNFSLQARDVLDAAGQAPEGSSIMMSVLLRPDFEPQYASMLTLVMGLSVAQAVRELDIEVSIKWPNDVVVSRKKICGILTEMGLEKGRIREVVIGDGINVNLEEFPDELTGQSNFALSGNRKKI